MTVKPLTLRVQSQRLDGNSQQGSHGAANLTFCFLEISSERTLEESSTWMALSSSRMLPSEAERVCRILSSISFSCFLLAALVTISACRSSSSSGLFGRRHKGNEIWHHHWFSAVTATVLLLIMMTAKCCCWLWSWGSSQSIWCRVRATAGSSEAVRIQSYGTSC